MFFYVIVYHVRTNMYSVQLSIGCKGSVVNGSINILLSEFVAYIFVFYNTTQSHLSIWYIVWLRFRCTSLIVR